MPPEASARMGADVSVLLLPAIRAWVGLLYGVPVATVWQLAELNLDAFLVIVGSAVGGGVLYGVLQLAFWAALGLGTSYVVTDGHLEWRRFGIVRRRVPVEAIEWVDVDYLYTFRDLFWKLTYAPWDPPHLDVALPDREELIELGHILVMRDGPARIDDFLRRHGIPVLADADTVQGA